MPPAESNRRLRPGRPKKGNRNSTGKTFKTVAATTSVTPTTCSPSRERLNSKTPGVASSHTRRSGFPRSSPSATEGENSIGMAITAPRAVRLLIALRQ
jgi:hypothetical protein